MKKKNETKLDETNLSAKKRQIITQAILDLIGRTPMECIPQALVSFATHLAYGLVGPEKAAGFMSETVNNQLLFEAYLKLQKRWSKKDARGK